MASSALNTKEERVLAALAHAGIIANPFNLLGIIGAALIWVTQRQQSRYVARHALQALVFQWLSLLAILLLLLLWGCVLVVSRLPAILRPELYRADPPLAFRLALSGGVLVLTVLVLCLVVYGLMGALAAWRGEQFGYALVSQLLSLTEAEKAPPAPAVSAESPPAMAAASEVPANEAATD